MARKGALTVEGIVRARPGKTGGRWLTDHDGRRGGQLVLRITEHGVKSWYFRYTTPERGRVALPLGAFVVEPAPGGLTLKEARQKQAELRAIYSKHPDLRGHFQREADAKRDAEERARREKERDATLTLRALMDAYVAHLKARGKAKTAADVESMVRLHLGDYATIPARQITPRDITSILRRLIEAGKGRTAAKFRAYMLAAYSTAVKADRDPTTPSAFLPFGLEENPVERTDAMSQFTKARDRVLSQAELAAFWKRLDGVKSEPVQAALRLLLLLGGQRPAQLLRLERSDVDLEARTLRLFDPKGKRSEPRLHELPITDAAAQVLAPLMENAKVLGCAWVFSTDGEHQLTPATLTAAANEVFLSMWRADEVGQPLPELRDLRRTCETMLAAMGAPRDVRAHLLSHGLSGVQHTHYDKHGYADEKRAALERWQQRLLGTEGAVIPIGRAAA